MPGRSPPATAMRIQQAGDVYFGAALASFARITYSQRAARRLYSHTCLPLKLKQLPPPAARCAGACVSCTGFGFESYKAGASTRGAATGGFGVTAAGGLLAGRLAILLMRCSRHRRWATAVRELADEAQQDVDAPGILDQAPGHFVGSRGLPSRGHGDRREPSTRRPTHGRAFSPGPPGKRERSGRGRANHRHTASLLAVAAITSSRTLRNRKLTSSLASGCAAAPW